MKLSNTVTGLPFPCLRIFSLQYNLFVVRDSLLYSHWQQPHALRLCSHRCQIHIRMNQLENTNNQKAFLADFDPKRGNYVTSVCSSLRFENDAFQKSQNCTTSPTPMEVFLRRQPATRLLPPLPTMTERHQSQGKAALQAEASQLKVSQ